jgi:serpin B
MAILFVLINIPFPVYSQSKIKAIGLNPTIDSIVRGNNQFAFNLYTQLKNEKDNIFFSPFSISTAMAMAYEGARAKTATEIQSVFNFPADKDLRRVSFQTIQHQLTQQGNKNQLILANALWVQNNFKLLPAYLTTIQRFMMVNLRILTS